MTVVFLMQLSFLLWSQMSHIYIQMSTTKMTWGTLRRWVLYGGLILYLHGMCFMKNGFYDTLGDRM